MSYPDYRALCAELLQPLAEYDGANPYHEHRALITRARAALAQPEAVGPTDEDLEAWRQAAIAQFEASGYDIPASRTVALLAIEWCRRRDLSAIAPVPVSEQPGQPGPVAPTDEELDELWAEIDGGGAIWAWQPYARAVLARWGSPNPTTATTPTP